MNGKIWKDDGRVYIGQFKRGKFSECKKYELQEDKTYTLFHVKFDEDGEEIEKKEISSGHKIV